MFQNRIFNVLEKANNNIKLTIVEHLVFSQIQRIQNSQREKKFEEPTKDENDTKTAPKRNKNKPISLTETKNHQRKNVAAAH